MKAKEEMWGETFLQKGYTVFLSSGGASLMLEPHGSYTSPNVKPPKKKPTKEAMLEMANQIIQEHEDNTRTILKSMPLSLNS